MKLDKGYLAVDQQRFAQLIATETRFNFLMRTLYQNAELSWDDEYLYFDSEALSFVLSGINPARYCEFIKSLREEKKKNGNDHDDTGEACSEA